MNKMINNIAEEMTTTARFVNDFFEKWIAGEENGAPGSNRFYSELMGMHRLLKAMDIDHELEHSDSGTMKITAIIIMGKRFEV